MREEMPRVPHPERVSEAYAEERIREKLDLYEGDRPRSGLASVNEALKRGGVPGALRLHYITAVAHLGRLSAESLEMRLAESDPRPRPPSAKLERF